MIEVKYNKSVIKSEIDNFIRIRKEQYDFTKMRMQLNDKNNIRVNEKTRDAIYFLKNILTRID